MDLLAPSGIAFFRDRQTINIACMHARTPRSTEQAVVTLIRIQLTGTPLAVELPLLIGLMRFRTSDNLLQAGPVLE